MTDRGSQWIAEQFEAHRAHLRAVAYRVLGSANEADDAVQEAWLRLSRVDASGIANLGGWLTTVVGRVCLDMLRSRRSRREESFAADAPEPVASGPLGGSPEHEALLADSVGLALLVVLARLAPAERLALDPDLVVRADIPGREPSVVRGAAVWAKGAVAYGHLAQNVELALVNGEFGLVMPPKGRLARALTFTMADGRITEIDVIGDPARLGELEVSAPVAR